MTNELTVEDQLAIQALLARYAWALDTGDVEAFLACFTGDAEMIEEVFEEPDRWAGREQLRALIEHYRSVPNFPGRQHHVSQVLIEGRGDTASARSFALVTECQGEPPYVLRFTGYYLDDLVRQQHRWLLQRRIVRLWDGEILRLFPGRGQWVPRKRPPELKIKR